MTFALTLGGRLIQFVLALAGVRIATTLLAPPEMGRISLILALTAMFVLFFVNPVTVFINRRMHAWAETGRLKGHLAWFWLYLAIVTALAGLVLWMLTSWKVVDFGMRPGWVIALVCGSLFIGTVNLTVIPALNMLGRPVPFMVLTVATVGLGLAVSTALVTSWRTTAEGWLVGVVAGQAVLAIAGYRILFARAGNQPVDSLSREKLGRLIRFAWPIAVSVALYWAYLHGYRFHLAEFTGLAAFGLFAAGYGLAASLLSAMETVLITHFQPAFYRDAHAGKSEAWSTYAAAIIPTSVLAVAVVIGGAPDLTALLLGPDYQSAGRFVTLGALAEGARMMVGLFGLMAHARMRTAALILPYALGTILSTSIIWFYLPRYGLDTAPVAVLLGGIAIVAGIVAVFRGVPRFRVDGGAIARAAAMGVVLIIGARALQALAAPLGKAAPVIGLVVVAFCAAPGAWWLLRPHLGRPPTGEPAPNP
ncbi:MAG TPA: hypothetical protein VJS20_10655 [Gemmatimonadales bacterium]|nr:hypothetical protein [Gemmatimonadales bacterium]